MVLYSEMDILMDIGMIEANTIILKKTVKYLNGEMKVTVEKRIKDNYKLIDDFFDDLAEEYKSIESYENQ
jgi:chromatin remodeling complex protein RSC6